MNKVLALRKQFGLSTVAEAKAAAMDKAFVAANQDVLLAAKLAGVGKTSMYRHLNSKNKKRRRK